MKVLIIIAIIVFVVEFLMMLYAMIKTLLIEEFKIDIR